MTQVAAGRIAPDTASLISAVPRPRESEDARPEGLRIDPLDLPGVMPAVDLAPARDPRAGSESVETARERTLAAPRTARRPVSGGAVLADTMLAVALATVAVAVDLLSPRLAYAAGLAWPVLLLAAGRYRRRTLGETRARRVRVVVGTGLRAAVVSLAAAPWLTGVDLVALAGLVAAFGVASGLHLLVTARRHRTRLVLAGRHRDVRDAMLELAASDSHDVVAVCLTRASKASFGELPTYVGVDAASGAADRHQADALVVLPGSRLTAVELRRLHWSLASVGAELCVGTGLLDVTPTRTRVFTTGGLTLVRAANPSLHGPRRWLKASVERLAATVGLLVLLPALLVVGLLIRLDSPGPAIYRQQRVGRNGRLFTMYKFRSMKCSADDERTRLVDCNEADGVLFKIQQDPRITRLGRWLRRSSIDEVPQLWNVVRGDMSLVGPRPALPEEVARYDVDPRRRLVVKPGLTGLWQVSGRSDLSWAESVRLDVRYVDNWSLGLDLAILARTVRAVLGHRGAY
jgi:exopolysaccharide biosynthesis polyprenyl glycosylphosphotransferase